MLDMFSNYDNDSTLYPPMTSAPECMTNASVASSIKGEIYGIKVRHRTPFTLYLHLECEDIDALFNLIASSALSLKILNTVSHKDVLSYYFESAAEMFNPDTCDLTLCIDEVGAQELKQESYYLEISLVDSDGVMHVLYTETDGFLIVR